MAQITDIRTQRRYRDRVNVYLDGEFWSAMSMSCVEELGLTVGAHVHDTDRQRLEQEILFSETFSYGLRSLSRSFTTSHRLAERMREKGYPEEAITHALARLVEIRALDDLAHARELIDQRRASGQGRRRVAMRLRDLGFAPAQIDELLDEKFHEDREAAEAAEAIERRFPERLSFKERQRALAFLTRRGFSMDAAREAVSERAMDERAEEELMNAERAAQMLERRYRSFDRDDPDQRRRAQGYLSRQGFSFAVISQALSGEARS